MEKDSSKETENVKEKENTKECRWCHEEMKEEATVCPHCQRSQKSHKGLIITIIVVVTIIIIWGVLSASLKTEDLVVSNTKGSVTALGVMEWEGDLTNRGYSRISDVNIIITCYSESREKTGLAYTQIQYIESGETIHFKATGIGEYSKRNESNCLYQIKLGKMELQDLQ